MSAVSARTQMMTSEVEGARKRRVRLRQASSKVEGSSGIWWQERIEASGKALQSLLGAGVDWSERSQASNSAVLLPCRDGGEGEDERGEGTENSVETRVIRWDAALGGPLPGSSVPPCSTFL